MEQKMEFDQEVMNDAELIALLCQTEKEVEEHGESNQPNLLLRDFARELLKYRDLPVMTDPHRMGLVVMSTSRGLRLHAPSHSVAVDSAAGTSVSVRRALPWLIIGCGILLRVVPYIVNRSLWLDEAMLTLNISNRSFLGLLKDLDYHQGAPFGFLVLEKLAVTLFGNNEYALRFFPLVFGTLSLFLFYELAKLCLTGDAVLVAVGLFSISGPLVYYSSEVKQYSSDLAVALLLFLVAMQWKSRELTPWRIAAIGAIGAAALWFSHPAVFVLASIGTTLIAMSFFAKQFQRIAGIAASCAMWTLSFVLFYEACLRRLGHDQELRWDWAACFVPSPLLSLDTAKWFADMAVSGFFLNAAGFALPSLAAIVCLVGWYPMLRTRREQFFILISPIAFALLAAKIHKYPFCGRMLVFLVPSALLAVAAGIGYVSRKGTSGNLIGFCLTGLLSFGPLLSATFHLVRPHSQLLPLGVDASGLPPQVAAGGHTEEEIKPVLSYLSIKQHEGDTLYVFDVTKPAFLYYAPKYGLDAIHYVAGTPSAGPRNWQAFIDDIDRFRGHRRVWFLFSHLHQQEKSLFGLLDARATRLDSFEDVGAGICLYEFSE